MGIDLAVESLATDWSRYADESLPLLASIDRLVPFGEARPAYDREFAERAFLPAARAKPRAGRDSVSRAVRAFQDALSARFDRRIEWPDAPGIEEYVGQIDPHASISIAEIVESLGRSRFPNLAVLDIENMYLPVELPTVLIGHVLRRSARCAAC